nr:MAG TPA: hypothetical protein [Caudoviricetes sp.]
MSGTKITRKRSYLLVILIFSVFFLHPTNVRNGC